MLNELASYEGETTHGVGSSMNHSRLLVNARLTAAAGQGSGLQGQACHGGWDDLLEAEDSPYGQGSADGCQLVTRRIELVCSSQSCLDFLFCDP